MVANEELHGEIAMSGCGAFSLREQAMLIENFGGVLEILRAGESSWLQAGMSAEQIGVLRTLPDALTKHQSRLTALHDNGITAISCLDPLYPPRLKQIPDFPLVLYARGEVTALRMPRALAVVGSRRMSDYGFKVVNKLVPELVAAGFVIVSGLAFGVDAAAHTACLNADGVTIAVQALGVMEPYPKNHRRLFEQIIAKGIVLSEFSDTPEYSGPELFPRRNRLVSGLCEGVLIIEAGKPSGTLVTAALALDQNRQVFAVPGGIFSATSEGANALIRQGAIPVTRVEDILGELSANTVPHHVTVADAPELVHEMDRRLYVFCAQEPLGMDELVEKTGWTTSEVAVVLARLELSGHLRATSSGKFHAA